MQKMFVVVNMFKFTCKKHISYYGCYSENYKEMLECFETNLGIPQVTCVIFEFEIVKGVGYLTIARNKGIVKATSNYTQATPAQVRKIKETAQNIIKDILVIVTEQQGE